jgi:hypothetical protein
LCVERETIVLRTVPFVYTSVSKVISQTFFTGRRPGYPHHPKTRLSSALIETVVHFVDLQEWRFLPGAICLCESRTATQSVLIKDSIPSPDLGFARTSRKGDKKVI